MEPSSRENLRYPRHLARVVHDRYFDPQHEEFAPRTMWSLSNAFTSAFKELETMPQFRRRPNWEHFLTDCTAGAPRIHGEIRMLGFELSERTVSRWMKRAPKDPDRVKLGWPSFETIGKRLQNEHHLKRLLSDYVRYHHADRTHLGLEKATPDGRIRSVASGPVLSQERLGGLHHRYDRAAA